MPPNTDQPRDRNLPRKSAAREARNASSRPKAFYWLLGVIALIGVAAIGYVATKPKAGPTDVQNIADTTNAGAAQGYLMGKVDAPVKILEYADFECPGCAGFATVTEPDVRARIIEPGLASITYYDFPLTQHRNTLAASNAAACADEQGKFWPMHDVMFANRPKLSRQSILAWAKDIGLDMKRFTADLDSDAIKKAVLRDQADGDKAGVEGTPTVFLNGQKYNGDLAPEAIKTVIDGELKRLAALKK